MTTLTTIVQLEGAPTDVFDDLEPSNWSVPLADAAARGLSMSELSRDPMEILENEASPEAFAKISAASGARVGGSLFRVYVDEFGLRVYRTYQTSDDGSRVLVISSCGEYQPARYICRILSVWRVDPGPNK